MNQTEKNTRKILKKKGGITLIALVVTIIVLLILAGISIQMLTGDNGILTRAGEAKTNTDIAQTIEQARLDILAKFAEKKGKNPTEDEVKDILKKYFTEDSVNALTDLTTLTQEITTKTGGYAVKLSEVLNGVNIAGATLGEKYDEYENSNNSMIGKTIDYKSVNNDSDIQTAGGWIILGKDKNGDILITTKNPVSSQEINFTLAEWTGYETKINNACKTYVGQTGTLGTKAADIKEVRSITLDDINNAVGFNETINNITISKSNGGFAYPNSDGTGWITTTDSGYTSWPPEETPIKESYCYYSDGYFTQRIW